MKPVDQSLIAVDNGTEQPIHSEAEARTLEQFQLKDREWSWLLWDNRRFLGRVTLYGLVLAALVSFIIPTRFQSTTRIMPPDEVSPGMSLLAGLAGKSGLGALGGLGGVAGDLLGMKSSGALFTEMLRSRTVQDNLTDRFDLRKVYWDRYYEDARKDLAKHTDITEDKKSGVISIVVTDHDPHRAQLMTQAYVEELDRLVAQVSTSSARRQRIFIEQRLRTVKHDLDSASQQFSEYASKNTVLDMPSQTKAMVEGAAILQGQLIAAESELEGLQQIYTGSNVRVRALQGRVSELKSQLAKMSGNAESTDTQSSSDGDQLYPSLKQLPLLGVRWVDLYRETKIQETVYELLTQQYELAKIQEAKEIPTVKVLDPANAPERKSSPKRLLIIILGTGFSTLLGAGWIFGVFAWEGIDSQSSKKILVKEIVFHIEGSLRKWLDRLSKGRKQHISP